MKCSQMNDIMHNNSREVISSSEQLYLGSVHTDIMNDFGSGSDLLLDLDLDLDLLL